MTTTVNTEAMRLVPDIVSLTTALQLDEEQRVALIAKRIEALSHPTRLRVLRTLAEASDRIGVNALVELLGIATQGTVSRHIQTLVLAGFLQCEESREEARGVRHYYHIRREAIREALYELANYTRILPEVAATG